MKIYTRILGIALVIAAIGGLIFSSVGLVLVWQLRARFETGLAGDLDLVAGALDTTSQGLSVADQSLQTSIGSLTDLESTISATATSLDSTTPMVNTMVTLSREDLPNALSAAQTSLASAQESARIIDGFLKALSIIPGINYNPPVPLSDSIQQVSNSLSTLPASLKTIETSLSTTSNNLSVIQTDIQLMAANVREIKTSAQEARDVTSQYQDLVTQLQGRVNQTKARLPGQLNLLAWVVTFILLWSLISELGMLSQGFDLLNRPLASRAGRVEELIARDEK